MKKKTWFTIIILGLFICGCSKQEQVNISENSVENLYYFQIEEGILQKYNLITGSVSSVCTDPICTHENSCLFSGVNYVLANENMIYFSRSDMNAVEYNNEIVYITESICSYDYETGRTKVLCEIKSGMDSALQGMIEYYDDYIYFYRQTPDPDITEYSLFRVSATGGEIEDMSISVPMWHGAHWGERLYFFDNVDTLYSMSIYGEEKKIEFETERPGRVNLIRDTKDNYLYFWVIYNDGACEIWKKDLIKNELKRILETDTGTVASLYRIGDTLYYLLAGEEIEYGVSDNGRTYYDSYLGKIYKISVNGGNTTTVYDDPATHLIYLRKCGERLVAFYRQVIDGIVLTDKFIVRD